mmetsp:Transcript_39224/g.34914  ORF Transcript_39224/g.34914 Transcript_39224/m.34914 type:complete len:305 (+) Transcript_39224:841-1755(+)
MPDKDLVIVYLDDHKINLPSVSTTAYSQGFISKLSFIPALNNGTPDELYQQWLEGMDPEDFIDYSDSKQEFIFVIDRSGSMYGDRIKKAKESLVFFLKSLPEGSYFNIYSFGSRFKKEFDKSKPISGELIEKQIKKVEKIEADFGGTEILKPLNSIYSETPQSGYQRVIFLLTDGAVSNNQAVIKTIKNNVSTGRVYSLGIGTGADRDLINGSSKAGRGLAQFVDDNEPTSDKVIHMLKHSMKPYCTDFKLEFKSGKPAACFPSPSSFKIVEPNTPLDFYIIWNKDIDTSVEHTVRLSFFNGKS